MAFKVSFIKDGKVRKGNKSCTQFLSLLLALFALTACPAPGPTCVGADEWGQTEDITVKVDPKKEYNPAGISVLVNEPLRVEISGAVDLCPDQTVVSATEPATDTATRKKIKPSIAGWQDSGITVTEGDPFSITVSGGYEDSGGYKSDGKGLYAFISPNSITNENDDWWYGKPNDHAPADDRKAMDSPISCHTNPADPSKCNPFFELWDNGTTGRGGSGFSGIAARSGKLYFRYARTADSRGTNSSGDDKYSPWKGYYRWNEDSCNACRITTITLTCAPASALFGVGYGVCIAGWMGGCASDGRLELATGTPPYTSDTPSGDYRASKCQEWYPDASNSAEYRVGGYWGNNGGDHFVNERASVAVYNNGPGYEIKVSKGCHGTYGKYMKMVVGQSAATLVPSTIPTGCTVGTTGCTVATDPFTHEPLVEAKFTVTPSVIKDMNSSGIQPDGNYSNPMLPEGFTERGVYDVLHGPGSGELWFKIEDTDTEKSAGNPRGSYYADNIGSYELHITTTKVNSMISNALNGLIDPIRKIIFGNCRLPDNPATTGIDESKLSNNINEADCLPKAFTTTVSGVEVYHPGAWNPGITQRMYGVLASSGLFINSVRAALVLMATIYGLFFMMGMIKDVQEDVIKRVVKVAIITQLIAPGSWSFFNQYLFSVFIDGMNSLIGIMAGDFMGVVTSVVEPITGTVTKSTSVGVANVTNPFAFIDGTVTKFFNGATLAKVLGLIFASPLGFMYALLIVSGMVLFLFAILRAAVLYILAMLAISLLLILAPLFFSLLLFEYTKKYFDNWIKSLMNYLFQPVLVFTALSIFNVFVYSALYTLLHYPVCWQQVSALEWSGGTFGQIPLFKFYLPDGGVNGHSLMASGMPMGFFMLLIFVIISNAMLQFVDFMASLAAHISIGEQSTALTRAAASTTATGLNMLKSGAVGVIGLAKGGAKKAGDAAANKVSESINKTPRK